MAKRPTPCHVSFAYGCSAMTHDGFEIIGGCDAAGPYRSCWQLKSEGSTWRVLDDAPEDFIFAAAESWERNLYIFGGCSNDHDLSTAKDTVWMRDANHHWHPIGIMPQGRMFICAHTSIAEKIYFFGGCTASENGGVVNHDDVFSFDCKTYGWTRLHSLPVSSRGASAVVLYGGRIAILGGYGETFLTSVLIYDVKRNLFTEETPLPVGVLDAQFVTHRGTLYGAGGEDGMRKRSARLFAGVFTRFI